LNVVSLSPFVVPVKAKRNIAYGSIEETINCNKVMIIKPIPYPNNHNIKEGNRRTSKAYLTPKRTTPQPSCIVSKSTIFDLKLSLTP
jgi:tRNA U54 and U55 pseudouridine synthase Pus10